MCDGESVVEVFKLLSLTEVPAATAAAFDVRRISSRAGREILIIVQPQDSRTAALQSRTATKHSTAAAAVQQ